MPPRKTPLVNGEIYHVFNRSIARLPIFNDQSDYFRALAVSEFYSFLNPQLRFSHFNRLPTQTRAELLKKLRGSKERLVEIYAFCFMPNHVHFLLKGLASGGIRTFMANFQNSFAKYINTKTGRTGSLFQAKFRAVRIETDEQFLHVARYIHLNPVTSYVIPAIEDLYKFRWSSFYDYVGNRKFSFVSLKLLSGILRSRESLLKFHSDQIDYQRKLRTIRHLLLE